MRDDGSVSGDDLRQAAANELYAGDVADFTERRNELAAAARAAGEPAAAKEIAALRKPTRSAWVVNRLVRADPSVPGRLSTLAGELRAAEAALDGPRIRELSQARRELVDGLVREALGMMGESAPSAALQEEVTAIFGAALADPQVAGQLAAGTLVRAEQRAGFGSAGIPPLALVREPAPRPAPRRSGVAETRGRTKAEAAEAKARARAEAATAAMEAKKRAAEAAAAEAEHDRQRELAEAEQAVAHTSQAVQAATAAFQDRQAAVRRIEEQLTEAREALAEARVDARQAENAERRAQQRLDRLRR
jgi:hypothetical protein